jgi:hypothetical protein
VGAAYFYPKFHEQVSRRVGSFDMVLAPWRQSSCLGNFRVFAPFLWALQLVHSGRVLLVAALLVAWTALDGWGLWELHRRKYLRLSVSVPCTILGIAAAFLCVWGA